MAILEKAERQEDKESGKIESQKTFVKNSRNRLKESIGSKLEESHIKYTYNTTGNIILIEDIVNQTTQSNEVDDQGNMVAKYSDSKYQEFEYDDQNMVTQEIDFWDFGERTLSDVRIKSIIYK